jgi:hypothetical protein
MLDPLTASFSPSDVLALRDCAWGPRKRRNAALPMMGRDATWAQMIAMFEGVVIDTLTRLAPRVDWSQLELIGARRVIDHALRCASEAPAFYAGPLYVSGGHLAAIAHWKQARDANAPETPRSAPRGIVEHVLPLATFASGTRILRDPATHLPDVRRAILGPVCVVTRAENLRLPAKHNPDPAHPFQRYAGIADVYRTTDGKRIAATLPYNDHIAAMAQVPAFASGAALMTEGPAFWSEALARSGYRGHAIADD